jgi:hypothetical protein
MAERKRQKWMLVQHSASLKGRRTNEAGEGEADVELDIDGDDDLSEGRNMDVNVPSVSSYAGLSGEANENDTYLRTFPSST